MARYVKSAPAASVSVLRMTGVRSPPRVARTARARESSRSAVANPTAVATASATKVAGAPTSP